MANNIHNSTLTKLFVAALMVIASSAGCQQNKVRIQHTYWPDGQMQEEWTEVSDDTQQWLKSGPYTAYYESGREREQGQYAHNKRNGRWRFWYDYERRFLLMRGEYIAGEMDGVWEVWMDPAHHVSTTHSNSIYTNSSGVEDSALTAHTAHQLKPHKRESYKAGKSHGLWISWHSDHQIADSANYVEGKLEGKVVTYFRNGLLASEAHYAAGALIGELKLWDKQGNRIE